MVEASVIVPANAEQKKDFIDLQYGKKDFKHKFIQRLREMDQEYTKSFKPFCYICAKIDFEDEIKRVQQEVERKTGKSEIREEDEIKIEIGDLNKYGNELYFTLLGTQARDAVTIIEGIKMPKRDCMRFEYVCKKRRHGRSVDMPWYAYEEKILKKNDKNSKV